MNHTSKFWAGTGVAAVRTSNAVAIENIRVRDSLGQSMPMSLGEDEPRRVARANYFIVALWSGMEFTEAKHGL